MKLWIADCGNPPSEICNLESEQHLLTAQAGVSLMKASTLFAVTFALLVGLVAVGVAKYTGFFQKAPAPPRPEEYKVLVAAQNLFEGIALTGKEVKVRPVRTKEEREDVINHPDKYLPLLPEAVNMRVLKRNIPADQPLLKEDFEDINLPKALHKRLAPDMRAVNVSLPRERCAGGLIQVGERVDVYLTSRVYRPDHPNEAVTQTAPIARNLQVVAKRNMLWSGLAPVPEDRPLQFTLEANPYRAALIEFAGGKGLLSLAPTPDVTPSADTRTLGKEFDTDTEKQRVTDFLAGDLSVGEPDLERIFNLKEFPPKKLPLAVELYEGTKLKQTQMVKPDGAPETVTDTPYLPKLGRPSLGYQFMSPGDRGSGTGGVPRIPGKLQAPAFGPGGGPNDISATPKK
jgi:Flp pilus assembly protein CpaB